MATAAQAVEHWLELAEAGLERDAEPALAIRIAALLAAADQRTAAAHALQHALARAEGASGPALASRVARAASSIDPETAAQAAWRALGSVELTLEERQSLEGLLAEVLPRNAEAAQRAARRPVMAKPAPARAEKPRRGGRCRGRILRRSCSRSSSRMSSRTRSRSRAARARPRPEASAARAEAAGATKPEAIEIETASRTLEAIFAVPTEFDAEGVCITASNGAKKRVRYDRIAAISVVAVSGLGPKPVILVDLILNWMSLADEPLRIIRLRGDRFDPRRLAPDHAAPVDALRAIIARLLRESNATPLPDLQVRAGAALRRLRRSRELSPRRVDGRFRERGSLRLEQLARSRLRGRSGGRRRGWATANGSPFLFSWSRARVNSVASRAATMLAGRLRFTSPSAHPPPPPVRRCALLGSGLAPAQNFTSSKARLARSRMPTALWPFRWPAHSPGFSDQHACAALERRTVLVAVQQHVAAGQT